MQNASMHDILRNQISILKVKVDEGEGFSLYPFTSKVTAKVASAKRNSQIFVYTIFQLAFQIELNITQDNNTK
jgi:hypothetical protein